MSELKAKSGGLWVPGKRLNAVVTPTPTPPPSGGGFLTTDSAFITASQIGSLSTTSEAALRAKGVADKVKDGTYVGGGAVVNDWHSVDSNVGVICLTTAIWWRLTGDNSYLAPLKNYMLATPKVPPSLSGRALDPMRQAGPYLAAVDILKKNGEWDMSATLPNHSGITFQEFLSGNGTLESLQIRLLDTAVRRWSNIRTVPTSNASTMDDSASNWGATARFSQIMWAVVSEDQEGLDHAINRMKKFLGDQTTGLPDFKGTSNYLNSWDNWTTQADGSNQPVKAGVGKYDPTRPGLDGVIINDIDRGTTGYDPNLAFYGATGSGRTYPLENSDYVWAVAAVLINMGYPVRTWGDNGDAFDRMNRRFALVRPGDTQSLFDASEGTTVYKGGKWIASRMSNENFGTLVPTVNSSTSWAGASRAMPHGDWLAGPGTTWMV